MTSPLDWKAAREWADDWAGSVLAADCLNAALDLLREADNLLENTEDGPDWYRRRDAWSARIREATGE